ncbi:hypothetical protein [Luteolibacter marinus]|uniref:hypothetical protein n=1 Tax=Luteolibacter marinus TaxID=2776705 RepID=UPI001868A19E|nr:hypothetical protein [Luteolibacter marinus]
MPGRRKTRIIAVALVLVSLANIGLLASVSANEQLVARGIRFTLTCILSLFLFRGAPWARGVVAGLCTLGVLASVIGAVPMLFRRIAMMVPGTVENGYADASGIVTVLCVWMVLMGIFFAWVAWTLTFDKQVATYFKSPG